MLALGIGDLHLDGRLTKYIPDLNKVIVTEVRLVIDKGIELGVETIIFYGDIGDKPNLSYESHRLLLNLFLEYSHLQFFVIGGNHDFQDSKTNGLQLLGWVTKNLMPNVIVTTKPLTVREDTDYPIRLLPWPSVDVLDGALNVLHIETSGSVMDSGRPCGDAASIPENLFCVAGHLHTNHKAKNVNFSGTLYQTAFGEKEDKFYHIIDLARKRVKSVSHIPKYKLRNLVIATQEDLDNIPKDPNVLCKLFIKSKVAVPIELLDRYPNVVKHNKFSSKAELEALVMEDFVLDDVSGASKFDMSTVLTDWMESEGVNKKLQRLVLDANLKLLGKNNEIKI